MPPMIGGAGARHGSGVGAQRRSADAVRTDAMLEGVVEAEPAPAHHGITDEVRRLARERFGIARLHREQERAILSVLRGQGHAARSCRRAAASRSATSSRRCCSPGRRSSSRRSWRCSKTSHQKLQQLSIPAVRLDSTVGAVDRRAALARSQRAARCSSSPRPRRSPAQSSGRCSRRTRPGSSPSTRRTASRSGATTSARRISRSGSASRSLRRGQTSSRSPPPRRRRSATTSSATSGCAIPRSSSRRRTATTSCSRCAHARGDEKLRQLAKLARRLPRPGIIYCSTTKAVEDVWLGLRLIKIPSARYHGKMTDKDRTEHQARFMRKGKRIVMVATSAFGLGIDKPDIRYIIHYQAPASLERYLQEAGRAGRDGHPARCILLFDESDLAIQEHLLALSRLSPALLGKFGRALVRVGGRGARRQHRGARAVGRHLAARRHVDRDGARRGRHLRARRRQGPCAGRSRDAPASGSRACARASRCCGARTSGACGRSASTRTRPSAAARCCGATSATRMRDRAGAAISAARTASASRSAAGGADGGAAEPIAGRATTVAPRIMAGSGRITETDRSRRRSPHAAAPHQDGRGSRFDPNERKNRRRRRRRGRRGPDDARPQPSTPALPPLPRLEPMDSAAADLAAELGAPGLPPMVADATAPVPTSASGPGAAPPPEGGRRRRRRRRRRGHGPRPSDSAPPPQT